MHRGRGWLVVIALASAMGCDAPERASSSAARVPARGRAADKAELFGDPTLVPTREGERARHELALAQEVEQAIALLPGVSEARVDVEQPGPASTEPARVLAVVLVEPGLDHAPLQDRVRAIAHAVVGPTAALEVVLETGPAPRELPSRPAWPLLLGVLGLGLCGGTLLERSRQRLRLRGGRLR